MKVHEYQARQLLADAGVPVPKSQVVEAVDAAVKAYSEIGGQAVVKAQVFAGGRGKAGFVKLVNNADEARKAADFMLKNRMVSPQTGAAGIAVKKLLVAAAVDIESEYYAAVVVDRAKRVPVVMVSREGGVEIEVVAHRNPDAIIKRWLHPTMGLLDFQCNQLVAALGFTDTKIAADTKLAMDTKLAGDSKPLSPQGGEGRVRGAGIGESPAKQAERIIRGLVDVFYKYDCSLAEINPLVRTKSGQVMAIDAKMNFDDNAIFRHKVLQEMFDPTEENPMELRAKEHNLSYIALDGNIGCLVNGAGLAMATMDIIKLHGGEPANFLDVGGSVTKEGAVEAFRIILSDNKVRGILVNIFGGIAKCDTIAEALIAAAKEIGFKVPVVVRLEGTNVDRARQLLKEAALPVLIPASDLTDAAKKVCAKVA